MPTDHTHVTSHYKRYHFLLAPPQAPVAKADRAKTASYDHYPLFLGTDLLPLIHGDQYPPIGVRLDDLTIGTILMMQAEPGFNFGSDYPSEFDGHGMVRALRNPMGFAYKVQVNEGDRDIDGVATTKQDAGYYYGWWKGLHCLMGKEGLDGGLYRIRPAYEKPLCKRMTWKMSSRAIVQLPSGDPHDPTFDAPSSTPPSGEARIMGEVNRIAAELDARISKLEEKGGE